MINILGIRTNLPEVRIDEICLSKCVTNISFNILNRKYCTLVKTKIVPHVYEEKVLYGLGTVTHINDLLRCIKPSPTWASEEKIENLLPITYFDQLIIFFAYAN